MYYKTKSGFTLVEVTVIILIIGILAAIAIPSWLAFIEVQRLNTAQNQVYRAMREAQSAATHKKLTMQVSFRQVSGLVQWAVHPTNTPPAQAHWNNLDSHVRLDTETTLESFAGVRRIAFDYRGNVSKPPLGRVTLSGKSGGKAKRCVYVSTILGAMRTAKEHSLPMSGSYCY